MLTGSIDMLPSASLGSGSLVFMSQFTGLLRILRGRIKIGSGCNSFCGYDARYSFKLEQASKMIEDAVLQVLNDSQMTVISQRRS